MDEAIVKYIKRKHNLLIGERTAELLKINIGTAYPRSETLCTEIMGRNLLTGLPKSVTVTSEEIQDALEDCVQELIQGVHRVLGTNAARTICGYIGFGHLHDWRRSDALWPG